MAALARGTRLGPYEVLAPLVGGLSDSYRARDTRAGRDVALKILPSELSQDPARLRQFEEEARAASALGHPNIVTIHEVGSSNGTTYVVMELAEGQTLREVASSSPLPVKRALDIAAQVADGLARAHAAPVVHRGLKPETVMVAKDGRVKILDFGLAKPEPPTDLTEHPTSPMLSRPAMASKELGYLSPEQASGTAVDFRSDQFSLGSILYEMLSGRRPFERETGAETLAAIVRDEPERLSPALPAPLRWIIERCLAKAPGERYASTTDLLRALVRVRDRLIEASPADRPSPWHRSLAFVATALALVAVVLVFVLARGTSAPASPTFRRLSFRRGTVWSARFAPDGKTVLYGGSWEGAPLEISSTRTDSPEFRSMGLPPGDILSVSSSGELALSLGRRLVVGWETSGTLARVPMAGGAPREILEGVQQADWSPDGKTLAVVRDMGGRRRLECPIGNVLFETPGWIGDPRFGPKGDLIAFLDHPARGDNAGSVAVVDLSGSKRTLSEGWAGGAAGLAWSPRGDEIWFSATKGGVNYDLHAVTLSGRERLVLRVPGGVGLQDIARDGSILLTRQDWRREMVGRAPGDAIERSLAWLDWSLPTGLSHDGKELLFEEEGEGAGASYVIYLRKTDGSPPVRLGEGRCFARSPDGNWILALRGASLVRLPTGAGEARPLPSGRIEVTTAGWFGDGGRILISGNEAGRGSRLYVQDVPEGKPRPMTPEGVSFLFGDPISPDGKLVAARGPDRRIALYPVDGGDARPVAGLSVEDEVIRWTADGRALYVYRTGEVPAEVFVVDASTGQRKLWNKLGPRDPGGVLSIGPILISRDGGAYVYSYRRLLDDVYLVQGLR